MFITKKDLEERNACKSGIKLIDRLYPNGAELMEILNNKHIPYSIFHWGYMNLPSTEEEKKRYFEVIKVKDSSGVYLSDNIKNSSYIDESRFIDNSKFIFRSKNILNSENISSSKNIRESHFIYSSEDVEDSCWVNESKIVKLGYNIQDSSNILSSSNIAKSEDIVESSHLWNCQKVKESFFCANCIDLCNSIFCEGLNGNYELDKYFIFNNEVNHEDFILYKSKIMDFLPIDFNLFDMTFSKIKEKLNVNVNLNFGTYYENFQKDFFELAKIFPNYSGEIMYNITFDKESLFN